MRTAAYFRDEERKALKDNELRRRKVFLGSAKLAGGSARNERKSLQENGLRAAKGVLGRRLVSVRQAKRRESP